jgi:hypothetical protein
VVLDDLVSVASMFAREADEFHGIMPTLSVSCPDGGDGAFNVVLRNVVEAAELLHTQIAGALEEHGVRLRQAYERYSDADDQVRHLCRQLIDAAELT